MSAEMSDIELIGYCEIHCTTERALFAAEHVNRMIELAGNPQGFKRQSSRVSAHEEMQKFCDLALARLAPPTADIAPPVAAGYVDTDEFRDILRTSVMCAIFLPKECDAKLIAHIDAWGAQQREAGRQSEAVRFLHLTHKRD